jgi:hypothetical protein
MIVGGGFGSRLPCARMALLLSCTHVAACAHPAEPPALRVVETAPAKPELPPSAAPSAVPFDELALIKPEPTVEVSHDRCEGGASTYLDVETAAVRSPHHDQSLGKITMVMRAKADGKELARHEEQERWTCVGFSASRQAYVLVGRWEAGISVMVRSILFWREGQPKPEESSFVREQLVADDKKYIVILGRKAGGDEGVFLLTPGDDRVRFLGAPPSPPPFNADENARWAERKADEPALSRWGWDTSASVREWETPLEPEVLSLSGSTLVASYGHDTRVARAKSRQRKSWDLAKEAVKAEKK